jgi:hypothetical protein
LERRRQKGSGNNRKIHEPGDNVTVTIALEQEGNTVDSVTRRVTVKERGLNCEDG